MGRDLDVARVRQRGEVPDLHVLPAGTAIGAPEQAHAQRQEHGPGPRTAQAQSVRVQHAFHVGIAHDPTLEVGPVGELDQVQAAIGPALPAVRAAHDASHFQRGVELVGIARVGGQAGHTGGKRHLDPLERLGIREPMPGIAAIVAPVDGGRRGAQVERPRIVGMHEDRPDDHARIREVESLPVPAAVEATVRPVLRAGVDHQGIGRMHGERPDLGPLGQATRERLPEIVPDGSPEEPPGRLASRPGSPVR